MMRTFSVCLFTFIFFAAGCADNSNSTKEENLSAADSVKLANKVYTEDVVDLTKSSSIIEVLSQAWVLEDDTAVIKYSGDSKGEYPYRSFYFSTDSSFIKNPRNIMEYGRWWYDNEKKIIALSYSNGATEMYKMNSLTLKELVLTKIGQRSGEKQKFVAAGKRHKDKLTDPYYIGNNRWRIKPAAAETDEAIRQRLKDCLHFYILFYRDNLAKGEGLISFYGFPTCLKWYAGGIFIVKEADLTQNWFDCFYNKADAMKAYSMMDAAMSKKYKWSKERMSWVKRNLLVLEQMYANL